jgi:integrase
LHVVPTLGKKHLEALKPDDVQRLYSDLVTKMVDHGQGRKPGAGAVLSARTVHHVHVVFHSALEQAVQWGYVPRNVCDVVEPPKVHAREMHPPTAEDLSRFLDAAQGDPWLPLWTVGVYTGARQGELLGLQWTDVNLDTGALTIQRTLLQTTKGGVPAYVPPKTAKSRRTIALPEEAVEALRTHRQRQVEQRLLLGLDYTDYGLVFATAVGTPNSARNTLRAFRVALCRAGLTETIRFHDLRHSSIYQPVAGSSRFKG